MVEKMKIKPPFIALFYLLFFIVLDYFLNTKKLILFPYNLSGIVFVAGGISLIIYATKLFKKIGTPKNPFKKPTKFVASGPYKFTRNPMYLGVTLVSLGIATFFGSVLVYLSPLLFFLIINATFIRREEKLLEQIFGKEYLDYKKQVRRWL